MILKIIYNYVIHYDDHWRKTNHSCFFLFFFFSKKNYGSGGIRTHASEETGALNQRLRPLGHAT